MTREQTLQEARKPVWSSLLNQALKADRDLPCQESTTADSSCRSRSRC
jgi:hypothetical protein